MHYWRFGRDDSWWQMDATVSRELRACDESVDGRSGEFRFGNRIFTLYSGAPFVYCVRAHAGSGIFFRSIVHDERVWNEIRVSETMPIGDGQNAHQEHRKRKADV